MTNELSQVKRDQKEQLNAIQNLELDHGSGKIVF